MTLSRVADATLPAGTDDKSQDAETASFLTAYRNTCRGALERYRRDKGIKPDDEVAKRAAADEYHQLPLLHDVALHELAQRTAYEGRGPVVDRHRPFPATLWYGGATATYDGQRYGGTIDNFLYLLRERASKIAPKRTGWVIEPTTNIDGHRTNESTKAVHALFLDCDGRGEWDRLLIALNQLSYAYVAYQSGGWSPTTPKWRVVLPLSVPFDTSTEEKQQSWKTFYNCARVVFGALGKLAGEGFDPATDTPCCPWFLTERRHATDPARKVVWHAGHSLDAMSLILALPAIEDEHGERREHAVAPQTELSDEKRVEIVDALAAVTASIPSGRHELYLALPGALLHRGIDVDDVRFIIEAVSASYPRKHADKHKDNIHNANTTIKKYEAGDKSITSIGTLNERWPEIAQAIDRVLPNADKLLEATTAMIEQQQATPNEPGEAAPIKKRRRHKLSDLARELLLEIPKMKRSTNMRRRFGAALIVKMVDGEPFQTDGSQSHIDNLVAFAMEQLGFNAPLETTYQQILDLAGVTLHSMNFSQSRERVAAGEKSFLKGQQKRRKWIAKRTTEYNQKVANALPQKNTNVISQEEATAFFNKSGGR